MAGGGWMVGELLERWGRWQCYSLSKLVAPARSGVDDPGIFSSGGRGGEGGYAEVEEKSSLERGREVRGSQAAGALLCAEIRRR